MSRTSAFRHQAVEERGRVLLMSINETPFYSTSKWLIYHGIHGRGVRTAEGRGTALRTSGLTALLMEAMIMKKGNVQWRTIVKDKSIL